MAFQGWRTPASTLAKWRSPWSRTDGAVAGEAGAQRGGGVDQTGVAGTAELLPSPRQVVLPAGGQGGCGGQTGRRRDVQAAQQVSGDVERLAERQVFQRAIWVQAFQEHRATGVVDGVYEDGAVAGPLAQGHGLVAGFVVRPGDLQDVVGAGGAGTYRYDQGDQPVHRGAGRVHPPDLEQVRDRIGEAADPVLSRRSFPGHGLLRKRARNLDHRGERIPDQARATATPTARPVDSTMSCRWFPLRWTRARRAAAIRATLRAPSAGPGQTRAVPPVNKKPLCAGNARPCRRSGGRVGVRGSLHTVDDTLPAPRRDRWPRASSS